MRRLRRVLRRLLRRVLRAPWTKHLAVIAQRSRPRCVRRTPTLSANERCRVSLAPDEPARRGAAEFRSRDAALGVGAPPSAPALARRAGGEGAALRFRHDVPRGAWSRAVL
jgi:hypothetical protein